MRKIPQQVQDVSEMSVETILSNISVFRVVDHQEQLNLFYNLWDYLEENPQVAHSTNSNTAPPPSSPFTSGSLSMMNVM